MLALWVLVVLRRFHATDAILSEFSQLVGKLSIRNWSMIYSPTFVRTVVGHTL